jgi:hypothetical protein
MKGIYARPTIDAYLFGGPLPPKYYHCRICGCRWEQFTDGSWRLGLPPNKPKQCCDNSPDFLKRMVRDF